MHKGDAMGKTTTLLTVLVMAFVAVECSAQPPGGRTKKPGLRDRADAQAGDRNALPKDRMRQGPQQGLRDPAEMVARLMQQFDKDGDKKLDAKELTAALTALRERGRGMQQRAGQRPGAGGDAAAEMQRRRPGKAAGDRRKRDNPGEVGGDKPSRPSDDN